MCYCFVITDNQTVRYSLGKIRFRHLTLLNLLIELGSLRKAAGKLHLTQPAASRMLQDLEAGFGGPLFVRGPRGMVPNPRALSLAKRGQVILKELGVAETLLSAPQPTPLIRIGAVSRVVYTLLPKAIAILEAHFPQLQLSIRTGQGISLLDAMKEGELDCVVGRLSYHHFPESGSGLAKTVEGSSDEYFTYQRIYDDPLCVIAAKSHPLARQPRITWKELVEQRWLLPPKGGLIHDLISDAFLNAGFPLPPSTIECDQYAFSLPIVAETKLVTVVSLRQARQHLDSISILPFHEGLSAPPLVFAFRTTGLELEGLDNVRNAILEAAQQTV